MCRYMKQENPRNVPRTPNKKSVRHYGQLDTPRSLYVYGPDVPNKAPPCNSVPKPSTFKGNSYFMEFYEISETLLNSVWNFPKFNATLRNRMEILRNSEISTEICGILTDISEMLRKLSKMSERFKEICETLEIFRKFYGNLKIL